MPKTPFILDAGPAEISPRGGMQATRGKRILINGLTQHWALHANSTAYLARCAHWFNSGVTSAGVTNQFLIGYEACSLGGISSWYHKAGPKPMTGQIAGRNGEPTGLILLNGHVGKLHS